MCVIFLFPLFFSLIVVNSLENVTTTIPPEVSATRSTIAPLNITTEPLVSTTVTSTTVNIQRNTGNNKTVEPQTQEVKPETTLKSSLFNFVFGENFIGDKCSTNDTCKLKKTSCVNGTCQCGSEYVPSSNKRICLAKAKSLMDPCADDIQCVAGIGDTKGRVACVAFTCLCAFDAYFVGDRCYKRQELGEPCQTKHECSVPFSTCRENVCACLDNMEPDEDNTQCIAMKSINAAETNCTDDHACSIFGIYYKCNNGTCGCRPGFYFSGSECVREKKLGDACARSSDCKVEDMHEIAGLRECKENVCSCIKGYVADEKINKCKNGASSFSTSILPLFLIILLYIFRHDN